MFITDSEALEGHIIEQKSRNPNARPRTLFMLPHVWHIQEGAPGGNGYPSPHRWHTANGSVAVVLPLNSVYTERNKVSQAGHTLRAHLLFGVCVCVCVRRTSQNMSGKGGAAPGPGASCFSGGGTTTVLPPGPTYATLTGVGLSCGGGTGMPDGTPPA